jgi:hypothetical protein
MKLAALRRAVNAGKHHVAVAKLALREGEELWDFIDAVWSAVQTNRIVLADGSLDAWLVGIYNDFVVVQDMNTGKHFQSTFTRAESGEFEFSDPVEVRMVFVPVAADEGGDDAFAAKAVTKALAAPTEFIEVAKSGTSKWGALLPPALRDKSKG